MQPARDIPAHAPGDSSNARLGLVLFLIYLFFYAAFVVLCVFDLNAMTQPLAGTNVVMWYSFGLIGGAFFLAIIYLLGCKTNPPADDATPTGT